MLDRADDIRPTCAISTRHLTSPDHLRLVTYGRLERVPHSDPPRPRPLQPGDRIMFDHVRVVKQALREKDRPGVDDNVHVPLGLDQLLHLDLPLLLHLLVKVPPHLLW
jgi:hypothetical protein